MWFAIALLVCAPGDDACARAAEAATDAPPACADTCAPFDEQFACCAATYGFGGLEGGDLDALAADCRGDACVPEQYLSAQAAACLAYGQGLGDGFSSYSAHFFFSSGSARLIVENPAPVEAPCTPGTLVDRSAETMKIDARTGRRGGVGTSNTVGECLEARRGRPPSPIPRAPTLSPGFAAAC